MDSANLNILASLADETTAQLATIWDTVGVENEDRITQLKDLFTALKDVYSHALTRELQVQHGYQDSIAQLCKEVAFNRERLGVTKSTESDMKGHMTLMDQQSALQATLGDVVQMRDTRIKEMETGLQDLHTRWTALGTVIKKDFVEVEHDLSNVKLQSITEECFDAKQEQRGRRDQLIRRAKVVKNLVNELCLTEEEKSPLDKSFISEKFDELGVHQNTMDDTEKRLETLQLMKKFRENQIKQLALEITNIWNRLKTSNAERHTFLSKHSGLGLTTIEACTKELAKLEKIKLAKLKDFVQQERETLTALWNETYTGEEERRNFTPAFKDVFTEEALEAHESKVKEVELKAISMRVLLKHVNKREQIKQQIIQHAESSQDPNRFKIPGRLLAEEKFRKMVAKTMPKLERKLIEAIPAWEADNGAFLFNGARYFELLAAETSGGMSVATKKRPESSRRLESSRKENIPRSVTAPAPKAFKNMMTPVRTPRRTDARKRVKATPKETTKKSTKNNTKKKNKTTPGKVQVTPRKSTQTDSRVKIPRSRSRIPGPRSVLTPISLQ